MSAPTAASLNAHQHLLQYFEALILPSFICLPSSLIASSHLYYPRGLRAWLWPAKRFLDYACHSSSTITSSARISKTLGTTRGWMTVRLLLKQPSIWSHVSPLNLLWHVMSDMPTLQWVISRSVVPLPGISSLQNRSFYVSPSWGSA